MIDGLLHHSFLTLGKLKVDFEVKPYEGVALVQNAMLEEVAHGESFEVIASSRFVGIVIRSADKSIAVFHTHWRPAKCSIVVLFITHVVAQKVCCEVAETFTQQNREKKRKRPDTNHV